MKKKTPLRHFQGLAPVRALGLSTIALGAMLTACGEAENNGGYVPPGGSSTGPGPVVTGPGPVVTGPGTVVAPQPTAPVAPGTGVNPSPVTPTGTSVTPPVNPTDTGVIVPVTPGTGTTPVTPGTVPVTPGSTTGPTPVDPTPPGSDPAGYWRQDDWHGCVWTGVDDRNLGSEITPQDFTAGTSEGSYCVSGSVGQDDEFETVALLGFNLAQPAEGTSCDYKPVDPSEPGPPSVQLTTEGIALNYVNTGGSVLRIQIQGPDGARTDEAGKADRWCYNVVEPGPIFAKWTEFHTQCWWEKEDRDSGEPPNGNTDPMAYYDGEDISAVVFTVPGTDASDTEFSFCVNGFAGGSSVADAPTGGVDGGQTEPIQIGVGNTDSARFARAKVAHEGETYVIQNNYWGNTTGSQVLEYFNNSFEVLSMSNDGASCNGCPVSFPSIFIGASGNTQNGQFSTRSTDNLPAAISAITSVNTSVRWSGSPGSAANAAYDIWFASPSRGDLTGKRYNDGLDGFIMLWLHNPGSHVPIGQNPVETKTIAGSSWQVWVGPRGTGPSGEGADLQADGAAPVISYVATSAMNTFNGDLKPFFEDAIGRQNQGSKAFAADLLLTDVFFGFEIWNPVTGLKVDSFTAVVEK